MNLEEFYDIKPERRRSPEADFGVWWTHKGVEWPRWKVSYVQATGEVYAMQHMSKEVLVLGIVPPDTEGLYYTTLNKIIDGWDAGGEIDIFWARDRIDKWRQTREVNKT